MTDILPADSLPVNDEEKYSRIAHTLSQALPYMRRFNRNVFVIKYGGHAMGDAELSKSFARNIVLLKQVGINPVVVHGGGPQIASMLERLKIESSFVDGLRVSDTATVEVAEMVLSGSINKQIVSAINEAGGTAVGLSGKDGNLVTAEKVTRKTVDPESNIEKVVDLGFVGEPKKVDPSVLATFKDSDIIPVIAPIGLGTDGQTYNINADTMAGAIAGALNAEKIIMLTDVPGVLDKQKQLLRKLTLEDCARLEADGTISGGMIPKIETCRKAVQAGVQAAHILDGRVPHAVLLETFTDKGVGTMIREQFDPEELV